MSCNKCGKKDAHCPICGAVNVCQLVDVDEDEMESAIENCWCSAMDGKLDVNLLPESLENPPTSCICKECWEKYQKK